MLKLEGVKLICETKVVVGKYDTTQKKSYISAGVWKQQTHNFQVQQGQSLRNKGVPLLKIKGIVKM